MEKFTISVVRKVEGCVRVEANSKEEAIELVREGLDNGTIDVCDDDQYWNDWEIE